MGTAHSKGVTIYYEIFGQGTPLLLIAGWGASGLSWEPAFIEALARNHRLIIVDNRGTGRSDKPDNEYYIPLMAEDCTSVLNDAGLENVHVLGASMGGLIAQDLALNNSKRVSSLILCCTSCGWRRRSPPSQRVFADTFLNNLRMIRAQERLKLRFGLLFTKNFLMKEWPRLEEHWGRLAEYPTPVYALRRQWNALIEYECCRRLSKILIPTLVMGGDADQLNPVDRLKELAQGIRGAELHIYTGVGHGFIFEACEDVAARIILFLKEKDGVN
ncbi:alpha/beta hydrolase [Candidatus Bathyarchaeota archaeon]|nr:alpha/beta hydrolase [Candidatus Bathyarchaeota archaeon]